MNFGICTVVHVLMAVQPDACALAISVGGRMDMQSSRARKRLSTSNSHPGNSSWAMGCSWHSLVSHTLGLVQCAPVLYVAGCDGDHAGSGQLQAGV